MPRKGEKIYKRKDGRWEARYIKDRSSNGKAIYGYVYAKSYYEVKNKVANIANIPKENEEKMLFSELADNWLNKGQNIISSEEVNKEEDSNDEQKIPFNEDINNETNTNVEQEVIPNENDEDVKLEENENQEITPNEEKENTESNKDDSEKISKEENDNEENTEESIFDEEDNQEKEEEITVANDDVTSGTCGDNLTWTLESGTLTISGTGDMYGGLYIDPPWHDKKKWHKIGCYTGKCYFYY